MITKYTIDLTQFNNGESDKITFPTFEQCLMYGMHKLKQSFENGRAMMEAVIIEDTQERKMVVSPSEEEIKSLHFLHHGRKAVSPLIRLDVNEEGDHRLSF